MTVLISNEQFNYWCHKYQEFLQHSDMGNKTVVFFNWLLWKWTEHSCCDRQTGKTESPIDVNKDQDLQWTGTRHQRWKLILATGNKTRLMQKKGEKKKKREKMRWGDRETGWKGWEINNWWREEREVKNSDGVKKQREQTRIRKRDGEGK